MRKFQRVEWHFWNIALDTSKTTEKTKASAPENSRQVKMDPKFTNVFILGFGFMFLFTSFQTMGNIEVS